MPRFLGLDIGPENKRQLKGCLGMSALFVGIFVAGMLLKGFGCGNNSKMIHGHHDPDGSEHDDDTHRSEPEIPHAP